MYMRDWSNRLLFGCLFILGLVVGGAMTGCGNDADEEEVAAVPKVLKVPESYKTIATAVAAAQANWIIEISPGEYRESLVIDKPLILRGAVTAASAISEPPKSTKESSADSSDKPDQPSKTQMPIPTEKAAPTPQSDKINGNNKAAESGSDQEIPEAVKKIIAAEAASAAAPAGSADAGGKVILRSPQGHLVECRAAKVQLENLTLHCNASPRRQYAAVYMAQAGELILNRCDIRSEAWSGVIVKASSGSLTLKNCTVHDNRENGLWVDGAVQVILDTCRFPKNGMAGVELGNQTSLTVLNSKFADNGRNGLWLKNGVKAVVTGSEIHNNSCNGLNVESGSELDMSESKEFANQQN